MLQCSPTTCPGIHLSLTFRSAELTTEAQCLLCIQLSKYRSQTQVSGATSLSSLQDTQKKLEKDKQIERFPTNKFQSTSLVENGFSTSIIGVERERKTKSERGSKGGEYTKCDKLKPIGGVINETKHQTKQKIPQKTATGAKLQNIGSKDCKQKFCGKIEGAGQFFKGTKLKLR